MGGGRPIVSLDAATLSVTAVAVFLTAFTKGAFGGGFAILGIPMMALVMDPITAGVVLAPLFCLSDLVAMRYWRPSSWSRPDLIILVPGQIVGIALGFLALRSADRNLVAIAIAVIALTFVALWIAGGGRVSPRSRSPAKGVLAGFASGFGSMVAHAGGPPVAMYLLPLGLAKGVYAGTTFIFFVGANFIKVWPWLLLAEPTRELWLLIALSTPVLALGVWCGWRLHERLDQHQLYRACYGLLLVAALKLLWDGISGYNR